MSEPISDADLTIEINEIQFGDAPLSMRPCHILAALLELQERRKAEQCQKCKGHGSFPGIGEPENSRGTPCVICRDCNGTGRKSALTVIYEIATRELAEPGDHSGKLALICTLIEDGPSSGWEPERNKEYGMRSLYGRVNGPFSESQKDAHLRICPDAQAVWRYAAGEWKDK